MAGIGFADSGMFFFGPKAICPTHGEVGGDFFVFVTDDPTYRTPKLCPKCYVDWVGSHVQSVTDPAE